MWRDVTDELQKGLVPGIYARVSYIPSQQDESLLFCPLWVPLIPVSTLPIFYFVYLCSTDRATAACRRS
jgi:hypothetical protein